MNSPLLLHCCLIEFGFVTFLLLGLLKLKEEFLLFFSLGNAVLLFLDGEFVALHFQRSRIAFFPQLARASQFLLGSFNFLLGQGNVSLHFQQLERRIAFDVTI